MVDWFWFQILQPGQHRLVFSSSGLVPVCYLPNLLLELTGSEELVFGHLLFVQSFQENNCPFYLQPGEKIRFGPGALSLMFPAADVVNLFNTKWILNTLILTQCKITTSFSLEDILCTVPP